MTSSSETIAKPDDLPPALPSMWRLCQLGYQHEPALMLVAFLLSLLSALPEHNIGQRRLRSMGGVVPGAYDRPSGCLLAPRCRYVQPRCSAEQPAPAQAGRLDVPAVAGAHRTAAAGLSSSRAWT